tara:strand:+ start:8204 stop:8518 length:315 start_codon:yes stop_codon:yes gene_type:complete
MIGISKTVIQSILLVFWLLALTAQPIITLLDDDAKVVVTNINEEEHQEHPQSKKNTETEKFFFNQFINLSQISRQKSQKIADFYILGFSSHTQKILLPPPKKLV